jgi:hypothetical protein
MTEFLTAGMALRPARPEDSDYCAGLYFEGMDDIINGLNQNVALRSRASASDGTRGRFGSSHAMGLILVGCRASRKVARSSWPSYS